MAEALLEGLRGAPGVKRMELCGSLRRRKETVNDIDILVSAADARCSSAENPATAAGADGAAAGGALTGAALDGRTTAAGAASWAEAQAARTGRRTAHEARWKRFTRVF